jgi:cell wall-associated NlpC family hydrolase
MSHPLRSLLVLCALAFSLTLALLKPLGVRAADRHGHPHGRTLQSSLTMGLRVVAYARRFLGVRYVYGGTTPHGFDCSGFVRYVYAHFGVTLPHSSYGQFADGRRVSRSSLRPGDLVFFDSVGHVGIYVGNGRFIHAPHTGTRVSVTSLAGWYSARFSGARRLTTF